MSWRRLPHRYERYARALWICRVVDSVGQLLGQGGLGAGVRDGDAVLADFEQLEVYFLGHLGRSALVSAAAAE